MNKQRVLRAIREYRYELGYSTLRKELARIEEPLRSWLDGLARWGAGTAIMIKRTPVPDSGHFKYQVRFKTDRYLYTISCYPPGFRPGNAPDKGYLGAMVRSREPKPNETWCRGNDLRDGLFSREIWSAILTDILAYEIRPITAPIRDHGLPAADPLFVNRAVPNEH